MARDFDAESMVRNMPQHPNVWSDGSFVLAAASGGASVGSGMYARPWECLGWQVPRESTVVLFVEEVTQAIQAMEAVHVGVDSLNALRHVRRTCDDVEPARHSVLINDGDLLPHVMRWYSRRVLVRSCHQGRKTC